MSLSKPLSSKPIHVKANTVNGKEKFDILFIHSFYAKRFYKKNNINNTFSETSNLFLGERDGT